MIRKKMVCFYLTAVIAFYLYGDCCQAGMVSLTFDDGLASVYKYAYPILKKNNQVATIGVTYSFLMSGSNEYMDIKQILALQQQGWEVAPHGLTHSPSTKIPIVYSEEKITAWAVWDKKLNIYRTRYKYKDVACLLDNSKVMQEVTSLNEKDYLPGRYYLDRQNKQLYIKPFAADKESKLNIRAFSCQREMEFSKKELEKMGCKIKTYITPYNSFSEELRHLSKNYYAHVASGGTRSNRREGFDPYHICRFEVHTQDEVKSLKKIVKQEAHENDSWVIFCLHGIGDNAGWQPWSAEKLKEFSSWLNKNGAKVVTIAEGVSLYKTKKDAALNYSERHK